MLGFKNSELQEQHRNLIMNTTGAEPCFDPTLVGQDGVLNDSVTDIYVENWSKKNQVSEEQAAELCAGCPVLDLCRDYAIAAKEPFGIWGGTTPAMRGIASRYRA